ncbi:MAG TPA: hypothetical protein VH120_12535 [Gemmataceae bacterium]|jgi:hypothetical protein|nr:hypothetical protein [Gemmataceae bacterium]
MAKTKKSSSRDRSSGEEKSNTGLIVTLVIFILATIGLGVGTYMGYGGKAEAEKQAKTAADKEAAEKKKAEEAEARRLALKVALGTADANERARFSSIKNSYGAAIASDVTPLYTQLQTQLNLNAAALPPWNPGATDQPTKTVVALADDLQKQAGNADAKEKAASEARKTAESEFKNALEDLQAKLTTAQASLNKANAELVAERQTRAAGSDQKDADIKRLSSEVEQLKLDLANKETDYGRQLGKLKGEVEGSKGVRKQFAEKWGPLLERLDQVRQARPELKDLQELHDLLLKALEGQQSIVNDSPKGQIVESKPGQVYINLGSAENVHPGLTFSVLPSGSTGQGAAGRPRKGAIEVVNVMGPHLSAAKVVEAANPARDPILRGDLLFNPAWDPTQKVHVAIAGIIDLNGSGVDGTPDLVRNLERQGIVVDAWLDLKDRQIKGPGITERTNYLVRGERPVLPPNMPVENPLGAAMIEVLGKMDEMKNKSGEMGVSIVPYRRFLSLIGYRLPKGGQQADYSASTYLQGGVKPVLEKDKGTEKEDKPK